MSGVNAIMREHESDSDIAVLKSKVMSIEAAIVSLTGIQVDIAQIKTKLEQIENQRPGQTIFCANQEFKVAEVAKRVAAIETWRDEASRRLAAWGGGLAVLLTVLTIFGPTIREMLTKP